jgi:hypothetical protein
MGARHRTGKRSLDGSWRLFMARLGHKARREMCPLYVSGLIGPGDRKSIQPMAGGLCLLTTIIASLHCCRSLGWSAVGNKTAGPSG